MKKIKFKIVSILIMTSVIPLLGLGSITVFLLGQMALNEARQRIESNLDMAVSIYQSEVDNLKYVVRDANRRVSVLMEEDQIDLLKNEYVNYCKRYNLDFFQVTDPWGKVLVQISNPQEEGKDVSTDKFVKRALRFQTSVSTEVMGESDLQRLGLADRAMMGGRRSSALVLLASMPLINRNEMIIGTMQAGRLINNNNLFVPYEITKRIGLDASVFLENMRVASSIKPVKNGAHPVGEVFDMEQAKRVLLTGRRVLTRIQISGALYYSGYTPLYDSNSSVIGMLSVVIPEKVIFALRDRLIGFFAITMLAAVILSFSFGIRRGAGIVDSVRKLRRGIEAFGRGDLLYRVDIHSNDELEELAGFFNKTMEQLLMTRRQLQDCSVNIFRLENTVNQGREQLQAAQKRLLEVERMAAMGRMAAALSHELRNTFAEINTGIYALKQKLCKSDPALVDTVIELGNSLEHASKILTSVLNFSYPKKPILSNVDLNYLTDDLLAMPVIKDMLKKNAVKCEKSVSGTIPPINADGLQLREMMMNIIVNAIQAMAEGGGGKLSLSLESHHELIQVKVTDTGVGMSEETLKELFTPFFTTKSRGLGLGLCISKAVIEEHGGQIQVYSTQGAGTTFVITLPVARQGTAI